VHGARPGPVLALIAGTHGYEYPAITALQRLRGRVSPDTLTGSLILVHIANPPSFYGRTVYTSPADGKNLNRVYPGRADGSLSERIADAITRQVIEQAIPGDLHGGDGLKRCARTCTCRSPATRIGRGFAWRSLAFASAIVIDEAACNRPVLRSTPTRRRCRAASRPLPRAGGWDQRRALGRVGAVGAGRCATSACCRAPRGPTTMVWLRGCK
jgi:predicted deacylase